MKRLYSLLKNEYHTEIYRFCISIAVLAAFYIFLLTRVAAWPEGAPTAVSLIPVFGFALAAVVGSFTAMGDEYKHGTIYTLMSLPVSGYMVIGAKFLLVFVKFVIYNLLMLSGFLTVLNRDLIVRVAQVQAVYAGQLWNAILKDSISFYLLGTGFLAFGIITGIFSYTVYRSIDIPFIRFLAAFIAYILPGYIAQKLYEWTVDILPPIWMKIYGFSTLNSVFNPGSVSISLTPGIFYILIAVLMFISSGWLYENRMEVL